MKVTNPDHQHHLGILRSVLNLTIHRTNERCSAARSAFFALNAVGSRSGCLHPITTHTIYSTLCFPILLYSAELWAQATRGSNFRIRLLILAAMVSSRTRADLDTGPKVGSRGTPPASYAVLVLRTQSTLSYTASS